MTPDDVRAAAEQLVQFHDRFAPLFGKAQAQDHAYDSLKGLLTCPERKSVEPIALTVGHGDVSGLPKFVGAGPWQDDEVMAEAQSLFVDESAPSATGSPPGVVGVVDESAVAKKGVHSAGVARQHKGRLGREDNCQVGVFLIGVTPAGSALLDHQLFLPESWCEPTRAAKGRRAKAHIPEGLPFHTQPRIAAELVRDVAVLDTVRLDWVVADEEYGRAGHFRDELEVLEQESVVEVPVTTAVWTADPATCVPASSGRGREPTDPARDAVRPVAQAAAELPASAWQALQVREGAIGPLVFEFAAVRVWAMRHRQPGPPAWLLIRRSLEERSEVKYYVSTAAEETALATLALVACARHRVEDFFEGSKSYLAMTQYEGSHNHWNRNVR